MKLEPPATDREAKLLRALWDASAHLEYCGYGDTWERSCAKRDKLPEQIEEALALYPEPPKESVGGTLPS